MLSRFFTRKNNNGTPLSLDDFEDERVTNLLANTLDAHDRRRTSEEYADLLAQLIELHGKLKPEDKRAAQEIRRAYLLVLRSAPDLLAQEEFISFMSAHIEPDDFAGLRWALPSQILDFYDALHHARSDTDLGADKVMTYTSGLLRHALRQFEAKGEYEHMFRLLQRASVPASHMDAELLRLRNRAHLYEMRRVERKRRTLYGYLALQVILIVLVFPFLFINAENGAIQERIEQTIEETTRQNVEVEPERERETYSYADGLYWSLITAGSIGYGDITPVTRVGKIIAASLGVSGVITIGVIAGLILNWITPRRLI